MTYIFPSQEIKQTLRFIFDYPQSNGRQGKDGGR